MMDDIKQETWGSHVSFFFCETREPFRFSNRLCKKAREI
jgi:hypothetical protein